MRKIKNILVLCIALLTLASCEQWLTQTPVADISSEDFWTSEKELILWMNGIYSGMNDVTDEMFWWGEGRSDNMFPTTYGNGPAYQKNGLTPSISTVDWTGLYTVISRCNTALDYIPKMSLANVAKEQYSAECHGIRALMYFYILRLWGACPLWLEPWDLEYDTRYKARSSEAAVSPAIETDINTSIGYFESSGSRQSSVYYFSQAAAYALKMDYLAWEGRFDEIIPVFEKFDASQSQALATVTNDGAGTAWKTNFTDPASCTEAIFSLAWDVENDSSSRNYSGYAGTVGFSNSNANFSLGRAVFLLMVQDTDDIRLWGVVKRSDYTGALVASNAPVYGATGGSNNNVQKNCKWLTNTGHMEFNDVGPYHFEPSVYRYAEVLLLYAEALNRTGDGEGAIEIINRIRTARGSARQFSIDDYPLQLGGGNTSREKLIMDERQLEFYGEGKRWFDLRRLDWGYNVVDAHVEYLQYQDGNITSGFGDRNRMLFPIYLSNLANNQKLEQNDGY